MCSVGDHGKVWRCARRGLERIIQGNVRGDGPGDENGRYGHIGSRDGDNSVGSGNNGFIGVDGAGVDRVSPFQRQTGYRGNFVGAAGRGRDVGRHAVNAVYHQGLSESTLATALGGQQVVHVYMYGPRTSYYSCNSTIGRHTSHTVCETTPAHALELPSYPSKSHELRMIGRGGDRALYCEVGETGQ